MIRKKFAIFIIVLLLAALVYSSYHHDIRVARIHSSSGSKIAKTPCGVIEYAEHRGRTCHSCNSRRLWSANIPSYNSKSLKIQAVEPIPLHGKSSAVFGVQIVLFFFQIRS